MKTVAFLASLILLTVLLSVGAHAQQPDAPSKIEVGVHFTSLTSIIQTQQGGGGLGLSVDPGRTETAVGGRFTFNVTKSVALEAEGNFFPQEKFSGFFNEGNLVQGQFGVKAGKRFDKFGVFGKARPGFASFSNIITQVGTSTITFEGQTFTFPIFEPKRRTYFSMDLGAVLEFYPSRKLLTRFDVGDTIIHYGSEAAFPSATSPGSRTNHNFQVSAGIGFRFGFLPPEEQAVQTPEEKQQRFEVGAQFSSLGLTEIEHFAEAPGLLPPSRFRATQTQMGFGGRFTYNLNRNFALETQGDFFPRDSGFINNVRAGGRILQGQAGVKIGKRFKSFGIFAKARPGVVSFSKTGSFEGFDNSQGFPIPILTVKRRNYFSFDLGGVLEFYLSRRFVTRFDGGDTMIRYGRQELPFGLGTPLLVTPPETIHNFQFSAGVGFRF